MKSCRPSVVSRNGQKFLMIKEPPTTTDPTATQASMVLVLNWVEELRRASRRGKISDLGTDFRLISD